MHVSCSAPLFLCDCSLIAVLVYCFLMEKLPSPCACALEFCLLVGLCYICHLSLQRDAHFHVPGYFGGSYHPCNFYVSLFHYVLVFNLKDFVVFSYLSVLLLPLILVVLAEVLFPLFRLFLNHQCPSVIVDLVVLQMLPW